MKLFFITALALLPFTLCNPVDAVNAEAEAKARAERESLITTPEAAQYYTGTVTATDGLNCRSCASTGCGKVRAYNYGAKVAISCAVYGQYINSNPWWDYTIDGCYVSEYYISFPGSYPPIC